jgi:DNA-binding CsgD family transcriptional regulator
MILADADARVRFANRAARTFLASRDGLRADHDGLSADRPRLSLALRTLIARAVAAPAEAGGGGMLALARASLKRPLSVLVSSLPNFHGAPFTSVPVALVLVTDPERSAALSPDYLRQLYGLTRMEAAVATAAAEGESRKAIGEKLGMAQPTVGSHLAQIFRKTGTHRQAELVRLLLQSRIDVLNV